MTYTTMTDYYDAAGFLPTHCRLKTAQDLEDYAAARERFLNDKLYLPKRLFNDAQLIEIGPDTGENALCFAKWGAHCYLAEPNIHAHPVILDYFKRYNLIYQLEDLDQIDIAGMSRTWTCLPENDFVIAEGFIYTVPIDVWLPLFARLLRPGGMVLISYYERYGGFIELFTKRIYNRVLELTGLPGIEVAHKLFDNKWALIKHTRTFNQWFLDVLEDPFVSEEYFLEAEALCQAFDAAGFSLYSSWPQYRSPEPYWHKLPEQPGSRAEWIKSQHNKWKYGNQVNAGGWRVYQLNELLNAGDAEAIIRYCQTDPIWLRLYGLPNHFAVFEKL